MAAEELDSPCHFASLFSKNVPHILEYIFFSLDYESYKQCIEVNYGWRELLTSRSYKAKAYKDFKKDVIEDHKKLRIAAKEGNTDEIRRLLSCGITNVNCRDICGSTPLHESASNGHKEAAQLLIQSGADIDKCDLFGRTPLVVAENHKELLEMLIESGANMNVADECGSTLLHLAARKGQEVVVQLLIERGAELNVTNRAGLTPLHCAANNGHEEVARLLIAGGPRGGANINIATGTGRTPLHDAAMSGHKDIAQILIDHGADMHQADSNGNTPLKYLNNIPRAKMNRTRGGEINS